MSTNKWEKTKDTFFVCVFFNVFCRINGFIIWSENYLLLAVPYTELG